MLQQTRIDSLDVTILRGGGAAVADWAARQGFDLTSDTPGVLEFYSRRSPYGDLTYDLAVAPSRDQKPASRDTGVEQAGSLAVPSLDQTGGIWPAVLIVGGASALAAVGAAVSATPARARRRAAARR